jgi:hypothetical protein
MCVERILTPFNMPSLMCSVPQALAEFVAARAPFDAKHPHTKPHLPPHKLQNGHSNETLEVIFYFNRSLCAGLSK